MTLLVFGATGQVARELQRLVPDARYLSRAVADLADPDSCARTLRDSDASGVINAAAWTAVDGAETAETQAFLVNAEAPGAMARAAAEKGVPFVHVSTDYVFDGSGSTPRAETAPTAPLGVYGRSKLAGEEAIRAAGGTHAILRTSWVFSAHGANFVKTMLRLSETRDRLGIVSDQIGGPTPAGAIAQALLILEKGLRDGAPSGTWHFAGAPDVSWAGFAREIFAQAGRDVVVDEIPTADYPTPAQRPLNSRLDCTAIKADFGIERPDWRTALSEVLHELEV